MLSEAFRDGAELPGNGLAAQARTGRVPAAEQGDRLLQLADLVGSGAGRAAGEQRERGGPLAHRLQQGRPGDDRQAGEGVAPAGDVVRGEAFHDAHRTSRREREIQRNGGDQREPVSLAGHVRDIGQQPGQLTGGDMQGLG
jgi:hypothetical protein